MSVCLEISPSFRRKFYSFDLLAHIIYPDFAEPEKPILIYGLRNGTILLANGSDPVTLIPEEAGKHLTYDPLRNTIVRFHDGGEEIGYDWVGRNVYHLDRLEGLRVCMMEEESLCTTIFSATAGMGAKIKSFILDPPGG